MDGFEHMDRLVVYGNTSTRVFSAWAHPDWSNYVGDDSSPDSGYALSLIGKYSMQGSAIIQGAVERRTRGKTKVRGTLADVHPALLTLQILPHQQNSGSFALTTDIARSFSNGRLISGVLNTIQTVRSGSAELQID